MAGHCPDRRLAQIESERETAYLLKSDAMRKRLMEAKDRTGGVSLDDVRKKLGI